MVGIINAFRRTSTNIAHRGRIKTPIKICKRTCNIALRRLQNVPFSREKKANFRSILLRDVPKRNISFRFLKKPSVSTSSSKKNNESTFIIDDRIIDLDTCSLQIAEKFLKPEVVYAIPRKNVKKCVLELLKSREMVECAKREGTLLASIVDKVSTAPLFIHKPNNDPANRLNFTPWVRLLSIRGDDFYNDPHLSDLYHIHELFHMAFMTYGIYPEHELWSQKMFDLEQKASLFSEAYIHFELPFIRNQMEISVMWVDRFMMEKQRLSEQMQNRDLYENDPRSFFQTLLEEFNSLDKKPFFLLDEQEKRTVMFKRSDRIWCEIWKDEQAAVEEHMLSFHLMAKSNEKRAISFHCKWIEEHSQNGVLFYDNAVAFMNQYESLKKEFNNLLRIEPRQFKEGLEQLSYKLNQRTLQGKVTRTALLSPTEKLLSYGITPTVYAEPWPETEKEISRIIARTDFDYRFGQSYLRHQDEMHVAFLDRYKKWTEPVLSGLERFSHAYATNGSSEAIKDVITYLIKTKSPASKLHLFEGEYEGIPFYAKESQIEVIFHPRTQEGIENLGKLCAPNDFFCITQPSSLDGNLWRDFDTFMKITKKFELNVLVDLAYVGCVAHNYHIDLSYSHIKALFFSLSKSMGTYYHRIGGCFMKEENPRLTGNIWFKNVLSQRIGTQLMKQFNVFEIPQKYQPMQEHAVEWLNRELNLQMKPSDVVILANQKMTEKTALPAEEFSVLVRGNRKKDAHLRACVTAWIDTKNRMLNAENFIMERSESKK